MNRVIKCILLVYVVLAVIICGTDIVRNMIKESVIYAMSYDNPDSDGIYTGVNTVGTQNAISSSYIEQNVISDSDNTGELYALLEQGSENKAEQAINIQTPDLVINGLKTKFRGEIKMSRRDRNILNRIVEAEAGGEDLTGRMLVANVVINRMKSSEHPDNIKGVVFEHSGGRYQFSPIRDGRYYSVKISPATKKAVKRVLAGEDNSNGARYFMCRRLSNRKSTKWFDKSLHYLFAHGCHEFFS